MKKLSHKKKVFLGISGGVDSSVSALLLKKQGYDVTGVYMRNWTDPDDLKTGECTWIQDRRDAMSVCAQLQIKFLEFDFEKLYRKEVIDTMFADYKKGRTPNPDILCNKIIKFNAFLKKSLQFGADYIATGHYAKITENVDGYHLKIPKDKHKDQTYFLYLLNQKQLAHVLFPLAEYEKLEVRKIATKHKLITAQKKDSQGICFVGNIPVRKFLEKKLPVKKGKVVDEKGKTVGEHHGAYFFTIGQRHGFTIFAQSTDTLPHYVVRKDIKKNLIVVSTLAQPQTLSLSETSLQNIHWISGQTPHDDLPLKARIRHGGDLISCKLLRRKSKISVRFSRPQRGVASGQSIVFYSRGECFGGGIIA